MDILFALMLWMGGFAAGMVGGYCLKGFFELRSFEGATQYEYEHGHHPG